MMKLFGAFSRIIDAANAVADSLSALSLSFRQANDHVRHQLALDAPAALETQPANLSAPPPEETTKKARTKAA